MLWLLAFTGCALVVYGPALHGEFVSDDLHYVANNLFIRELSLRNLIVLFDPFGASTITIVNYAPVQMFLHTLAWQAFGPDVLGHHVVNVVLHALASVLLIAVFTSTGIPRSAAVLGAALFLLHPANVEAVAWINQLKSSSAMVLSLAALLTAPRRPVWGAVLFAAALLAKPIAAYALPAAVLFEWAREGRVRWRVHAVWAALFVAFAAVEFAAHQRSGAAEAALYETPLVLVRTVAALAMRYLVMASTSLGVSAFHEPEPAWSALDPWWLASLPVLALLGWRAWVAAHGPRAELGYWVWAVAAFAPVSQIFPFLYPMADRYLYFILPGLLGGALLAGGELLARLPAGRRLQAGRVVLAAGVALCVFFAVRSFERAAIWRSGATLLLDAAKHYPEGVSANLLRAKRAAQVGDIDAVVTALRAAEARGYNRFDQLMTDPGFAGVRSQPAFREVVYDIAGGWIERGRLRENPTQLDLRMIANAHYVRGEIPQAIDAFRRALELGGVHDEEIRRDLEKLTAP